jgi:hypothetical protein
MEPDMAMCGPKKMAKGGKAKKMMGGGYVEPMKMAKGGKMRGGGAAIKGLRFTKNG